MVHGGEWESGTSGGALENMRSALTDTLVPESTNSPFVIVLGVTLQAGIVALL
jgi:hypothetical protein